MSEEEVINILTNFLTLEDKWRNRFNKGTVPEAIDTVLQLLEQKDKRIDDLEKALVDEAIKSTEKIKQLNKGINTLMTKRKKWKNGYYNKKNKAKELNYKINKVIYKLRNVEEDYINVCPDCLDLSADLLKILEE